VLSCRIRLPGQPNALPATNSLVESRGFVGLCNLFGRRRSSESCFLFNGDEKHTIRLRAFLGP
jgi:hypothetical protein